MGLLGIIDIVNCSNLYSINKHIIKNNRQRRVILYSWDSLPESKKMLIKGSRIFSYDVN